MALKSLRALRALVSCSFALALCAPSVFADPLPVELADSTPNRIQVSSNTSNGAYPLTVSVPGFSATGGGFGGTVWEGMTTASDSYSTTMWCVDSQLYFSNNNAGLANITLLNSLPNSQARYGTIGGPIVDGNSPGWTNDLGAMFDTAAVRFQMAAYLVSQYTPFNNGPANTPGPTRETNSAIQRTIWAIMHNNTPGADTAGWSEINGGAAELTEELHWLNEAKANYASVDTTKWAVVTWLVNSDGTFKTDDKQTFLVQVTPEPGFYAVLGIGLILLLVVRRRRQNTLGELAS